MVIRQQFGYLLDGILFTVLVVCCYYVRGQGGSNTHQPKYNARSSEHADIHRSSLETLAAPGRLRSICVGRYCWWQQKAAQPHQLLGTFSMLRKLQNRFQNTTINRSFHKGAAPLTKLSRMGLPSQTWYCTGQFERRKEELFKGHREEETREKLEVCAKIKFNCFVH